jgi:hypothetical protein
LTSGTEIRAAQDALRMAARTRSILRRLEALNDAEDSVAQTVENAVAEARDESIAWAEIGEALGGLSKKATWFRYGQRRNV